MRITNDGRARPAGPGASAGDARPFGARRLLASRWRVPVVFSLLAAGAVLAAPAVASASPLPPPVTGHVYLDDNTAGTNTIAAFDRHADGSLTLSRPGFLGGCDFWESWGSWHHGSSTPPSCGNVRWRWSSSCVRNRVAHAALSHGSASGWA